MFHKPKNVTRRTKLFERHDTSAFVTECILSLAVLQVFMFGFKTTIRSVQTEQYMCTCGDLPDPVYTKEINHLFPSRS
jgi:ATP-dependent exoDNAse (exonuclease V) alpha subunit